ncbi:hypothetical protein DEF23_25185 [Marinitenerispora sediminis]|uniref:Uncharacterized protein n=1 Tax=Marinitenerispora sediminis TaxID=1931232 RepID=A0A368T5R8_9ACTN|nr:hypothetical protein DEF23_25185 [Marinitenerispora sediminis]RCV52241.1 hypothetical protein DEF28_13375 [Marinitenerispora sediminis]RCV59053.1 hypothetical protein DEF24_11340 [Marinitenerispora sediminis]
MRPESGGSTGRLPRRALAGAAYTVLTALGLVAGTVGGLASSWLSWLWLTGAAGQGAAAAALVLMLLALFAGCRAAGWGMGTRLGAGLPAGGWIAASFLLVSWSSSGDVVLTAAAINYAFLFGGIAVAVLATALTAPAAPR